MVCLNLLIVVKFIVLSLFKVWVVLVNIVCILFKLVLLGSFLSIVFKFCFSFLSGFKVVCVLMIKFCLFSVNVCNCFCNVINLDCDDFSVVCLLVSFFLVWFKVVCKFFSLMLFCWCFLSNSMICFVIFLSGIINFFSCLLSFNIVLFVVFWVVLVCCNLVLLSWYLLWVFCLVKFVWWVCVLYCLSWDVIWW